MNSFGANYKGKKSCSLADASATSFFPAKPLGCYGDGGAIFTNSQSLADQLFSIRVHGQGSDKYDNVRLGMNGRLDTIQAAILLEKLKIFNNELDKRNEIADYLKSKISNDFQYQKIPLNYKSSWASYALLCKDYMHRTEVLSNFEVSGIPTKIYYEKPLHMQDMFHDLNHEEGSFPISEDICKKIFSIPFHPYMTQIEMEKIINCLNV